MLLGSSSLLEGDDHRVAPGEARPVAVRADEPATESSNICATRQPCRALRAAGAFASRRPAIFGLRW